MTNLVLQTLIARVKAEAAAHASQADQSEGSAADDGAQFADFDAEMHATGTLGDAAGEGIVDRLLMSDGREFVDLAYSLLLHREADDAGRANYGSQLAGGASRLLVAAKIRLSDEGRRVGTSLDGLRVSIVLAAADRVLRRIGLGALTAKVMQRLEKSATQRAVGRTLVIWRRRFEHSVAVIQRQGRKFAELSREISAVRAYVDEVKLLIKPQPPVPVEAIDTYYLAFENANRGSREEILAKLAIYNVWLKDRVPLQEGLTHAIVDLGCGRGEWLSHVAERGYEAIGADTSPMMIEACQKLGYNVRCMDALSFLRGLPTNSIAAVTGFHIIEHVPFDYLFAMVQECARVLVKDGSVLFETPNPENVLVGSHTFYHDFTHRNPITPTAISFLLKYHGFVEIDIIRSSPYPDEAKVPGDDPLTARVNGHLCGPQDFAVTGRRGSVAGARP